MVAGSRAGPGGSDIGMAAIMAPQSAIQRTLLAYVRTQEDQADHAGVKFLNATGQSPKGMVDLFTRLTNESLSIRASSILSANPSDAGRTRRHAGRARQDEPQLGPQDSAELQLRHDMMRAKLSGFMDRPDTVARRYTLGDNSLPARYARAISATAIPI